MNIKNGRISIITKAPSTYSYLTFSEKGDPLYSVGLDKSNKEKNVVVVHQYVDGKWEKLNPKGLDDTEEFRVISETENSSEVYLYARFLNKTDRIYRYNVETGSKTLVFAHAKVDPHDIEIDDKTRRMIAVHFEDGEPNLHIIDENHIHSKWYPNLFQVFQGKRVLITSATEDGSKMIVHVSGANEPGQFHLFDTNTKKLRYLFNAASWVNTEQLSQTQPVSFKARDGLEIHGYLTHPKNAKKSAPLIVMPHGGPHGVRDQWIYNPEVQFLTSRGYGVLQVNFRGSGGYGLGFEKAGYRQWGGKIQQDIIDGTRWALKQEGFDKDKVCIMGGSFGGYSALMSSILEPDLYKCAIGFVGVYDLALMYTTGDIDERKAGLKYLKDVIGEDEKELAQFSPVTRVAELKAPVLLIHGEDDWRADVKHFEVMKKALEKKGHPLETMLVDKEGHGFANEKNRIEYFKRIDKFLAQYLGNQVYVIKDVL
jgi:dipeptidyl aminopeptidase/acylaminoacyl peptidase